MKFSVHGGDPTSFASPRIRLTIFADVASASADAEPMAIGAAEDFAQLLAKHRPRLFFETPNILCPEAKPLEVDLTIDRIAGFDPASIIASLPPLRRVQALIGQLERGAKGELPPQDVAQTADGCRDLSGLHDVIKLCHQAIAAAKTDASSSAPASRQASNGAKGSQDAAVSRILGMVDVPSTQERAVAAVSGIVSQLNGNRSGKTKAPQLAQATSQASELLDRQLDVILHHPVFQQAEATWRGLRFLVERTNFRRGIVLELRHTVSRNLEAILQRYAEQESAVSDEGVDTALLVVPCALDAPASDGERMQRMAEAAEMIQVPLLCSVGPGFFGLSAGNQAQDLPFVGQLLDQAIYTKYNSLRRKPCARWLAPCFNRFVLRPLHDGTSNKHGSYSEQAATPQDYLWGDPVWAIASLVTASFAQTGWPTEILGHDGRIEDLALYPFGGKSGAPSQIPLEAPLSEQLVRDLARAGFTALSCRRNSDWALVGRAPTCHRPEGEVAARRTDRALPYQMLVARLVHGIHQYRQRHTAVLPEEIKAGMEDYLQGLLGDIGPGGWLEVTAKPSDDDPQATDVRLDFRAGHGLLRGLGVELSLTFR